MEEVVFLLLTIAIELPIALWLLRRADWRRVILVVVGVNMISHPIIWQLIYFHGLNWFAAEVGVAIFEGLVLALMMPKIRARAFLTGVFMNLGSASVGLIFF